MVHKISGLFQGKELSYPIRTDEMGYFGKSHYGRPGRLSEEKCRGDPERSIRKLEHKEDKNEKHDRENTFAFGRADARPWPSVC